MEARQHRNLFDLSVFLRHTFRASVADWSQAEISYNTGWCNWSNLLVADWSQAEISYNGGQDRSELIVDV